MVELEDHAEVLIAEQVPSASWHVINSMPLEADRPSIGLIKRGEQVQQCALSAAALTYNSEKLAFAHFQFNTLKHGNSKLALAVALKEVAACELDRRKNWNRDVRARLRNKLGQGALTPLGA
jgi:hypothetical protein